MEYEDTPSCVWRIAVFPNSCNSYIREGRGEGKLDLVVAGVVGGELRLEMAGGNLAHRSL